MGRFWRGGDTGWAPSPPSGAQRELVLLDGLLDPGPQAGLVEGLDERLLGLVVLAGRLLGLVIGAGLQHLVPQDGRQLDGWRQREEQKREEKSEIKGGDSESEKVGRVHTGSPHLGTVWGRSHRLLHASKRSILVPLSMRGQVS